LDLFGIEPTTSDVRSFLLDILEYFVKNKQKPKYNTPRQVQNPNEKA